MISFRTALKGGLRTLPYLLTLAVFGLMFIGPASANHPVLVEGNCDSPVPIATQVPVVPGTGGSTSGGICGDWDGDGRISTAEDTDGADRIFGTLNAAMGPGTGAAAGTGANFNGSILIVQSGRFAEQIQVVNPGGNIEIAAAPGVEAIIDAVLQGDPAGGNNARQESVGLVFNTTADRRIILRNLTIRNWSEGVRVGADTRMTIQDCRIENNRDFGVRATDNARVAIYNSEILSTGFRVGTANNVTPFGHAVFFEANAGGVIGKALITGSLRNPVLNISSVGAAGVRYYEVILSHNGTDVIANATREPNP